MTALVLIRHAPTPWNRAKRLQGHSDIALDDAGRAVAASWRPGVAGWIGWRLLSSPLRRASETAELLFPGQSITIEPRLIEMSFGDWEGKTLTQLRGEKGAEVEEREVMGLDFQAPGGESPRQVQQRLQPLLAELARDNRNTVCIAHKAVLRALYAWAVGWDMRVKPPQKVQFGCAHLFDLDVAGRPALRQLNIPLSNRNIPA
jgi:probable phosphoglycerate mutase